MTLPGNYSLIVPENGFDEAPLLPCFLYEGDGDR